MYEGLRGGEPVIWINDEELLQEVDHLWKCVAVLVRLQAHPQVEVLVDVDRLVCLEGRLPRADVEHDTAQGPRVNFEICVLLIACFRRRPLTKTRSESNPWIFRRHFDGHI